MPAIGIMLGLATAGQGGGAFGPQSISSLALWHDASLASTVTLNVADVASISDRSGNSRTASMATAAEQPAYTSAAINGLNAITFTGANNDALNIANARDIARNRAGITWVGVVRFANLTGSRRIFTVSSGGGSTLFSIAQIITSGVIQVGSRRVSADTLSQQSSTVALVANQAAFLAVSVNFATGAIVVQIDGTSETLTAGWTVGAASEDVSSTFDPAIGRSGANTFSGVFAEGMFYSKLLSSQEISDLRTRYLKPKWNLA